MTQKLAVVATLEAKSGHGLALKAALKKVVRPSRDEAKIRNNF